MAGNPGKRGVSRRLSLILLGSALLVLLLVMSGLNAFHLALPYSGSPLALFLFTAITVVLFVLLLLLLVLLARNILRLYGDGRSRVLGSRLRSRMLLGALLLSFAPIVFMALFSFLLMNRSLDRWFSQPVANLRDQSLEMGLQFARYVTAGARTEAESLARSPAVLAGYAQGDPAALAAEVRRHRLALKSGFVLIYRDAQPVASYQVPRISTPATVQVWPELASGSGLREGVGGEGLGEVGTGQAPAAPGQHPLGVLEGSAPASPSASPSLQAGAGRFPASQAGLAAQALRAAEGSDNAVLSFGAGNDYALASAPFDDGGTVVVALPLPSGLGASIHSIAAGAREYWAVYRQRRALRSTFLLLLTLVTTLTFFASSWLALFLSKQITRPVEALADAMDALAAGDYRQRIISPATDELSELIGSFNQMASDLEQSRQIADFSTAQLEQANGRLKERQHELELILETIPSGVAVLDGEHGVLQVNRAFLDLLARPQPGGVQVLPRSPNAPEPPQLRLENLLPGELLSEVLLLERRAQRMGVAGVELELPRAYAGGRQGGEGDLSLSVTIAVLNLGRDERGALRQGSILVIDDVSEVLQAQRQVAWKEVAQRVAHEIRNPLTPIALSAERILRHVPRLEHGAQGQKDSHAVIERCSQVILSSVESMRLLVEQFATLAEFPAAQPREASLNEIVGTALALFQGRLQGIRVETTYLATLPPVLADPEALKRALANLIDNAAEAMTGSFHKVLRLETSLSERLGMAELLVSDTGPGLSAEVRERLFLPYFSTKQRGTGLGLAIAAKVVQDHHGSIRAEQRHSVGACFVIELPLVRAPEPALDRERVTA